MNKLKIVGGSVILLAVLAGVWWSTTSSDRSGSAVGRAALPTSQSIVVPELSPVALTGEATFNASCAICHGTNAAGTDQGPPLIHKFYISRRHADFAFVIAAKSGVRAHHWRFGSMPPVEGIEDADIQPIITYIREIQAANGL
ncbi:MAG: cytochrome c [Rhodobacteraceae bacterium]|nr:cytochrome c [Paracoccaceae bacterium]